MIEVQNTKQIEVSQLVNKVTKMNADGQRLVQIGCTGLAGGYEINYTFDKDYAFSNLRITITATQEVPTIQGIYLAAFIYENEISDLFGINITGMLVDFKGQFYKTSVTAPFGCKTDTAEGGGENV